MEVFRSWREGRRRDKNKAEYRRVVRELLDIGLLDPRDALTISLMSALHATGNLNLGDDAFDQYLKLIITPGSTPNDRIKYLESLATGLVEQGIIPPLDDIRKQSKKYPVFFNLKKRS